MRRNITRWSPSTCGCVVELESEYDNQGNLISDNKFLLMNEICDKHKALASTTHRENHAQLSNHTLDLIEEAKSKNLGQVHGLLEKAVKAIHKKDL
jgi:hypothetical protein